MRPRRPSGPTWPRSARTSPTTSSSSRSSSRRRSIKKGYEPVTIATDDGRTITGLLVEERPDAVVLRDPAQDGKPVTIARDRIEERRDGGPSLMPAGLVNALASRQQFLDLVRYLMEIAEYGPARARALRPDPALVAPPLPEYERRLDHAGLIAGLGSDSLRRGEAIYARVCANCHGTRDQPGSLPNAPRGSPPPRSRTAATRTASIAPSPTASARWRPSPGWSPGRSTTSSTTSARRSSSPTTRPSTPRSTGRTSTGSRRGRPAAPRRRRSSPGSRWITARA